jgi:AraC-like DNA-binding protein
MYVSALMLRGIHDALRSRGFSAEQLLAGTGIDGNAFSDPGTRIYVEAVDRYLVRTMELTNDPGLALTLVASAPAGAQTLLYHMVLACKTIREAARPLERLAGQLLERASFEVVEEGDSARFVYRSGLASGPASRFAAEYVLGFAHRLATHFYHSPGERPRSAHFRHARPSHDARYGRFFGCGCSFGAEENELVFSRAFLDQGHSSHNEVVKQSIVEAVHKVLVSRPVVEDSLSVRIQLHLRETRDFDDVSSLSIAGRLGLSERSLRRKLSSEGISLGELVDKVKMDIACEQLARAEASIEHTASQLGFANRTGFHRAFKRWTGETPQAFRARLAG